MIIEKESFKETSAESKSYIKFDLINPISLGVSSFNSVSVLASKFIKGKWGAAECYSKKIEPKQNIKTTFNDIKSQC